MKDTEKLMLLAEWFEREDVVQFIGEHSHGTEVQDDLRRIAKMITKIDKDIKSLEDQVKIQCSNGNWNYDPYMLGMANGLICAIATIKDEEPDYLNSPEIWLCDNMRTC